MLVLLHNELLQGNLATLERLRRTAPASTSSSRQEKVLACGNDLLDDQFPGEPLASPKSMWHCRWTWTVLWWQSVLAGMPAAAAATWRVRMRKWTWEAPLPRSSSSSRRQAPS